MNKAIHVFNGLLVLINVSLQNENCAQYFYIEKMPEPGQKLPDTIKNTCARCQGNYYLTYDFKCEKLPESQKVEDCLAYEQDMAEGLAGKIVCVDCGFGKLSHFPKSSSKSVCKKTPHCAVAEHLDDQPQRFVKSEEFLYKCMGCRIDEFLIHDLDVCVPTKFGLYNRIIELGLCDYYTQVSDTHKEDVTKINYDKKMTIANKNLEYYIAHEPLVQSCVSAKGTINYGFRNKVQAPTEDSTTCAVKYKDQNRCQRCKEGYVFTTEFQCSKSDYNVDTQYEFVYNLDKSQITHLSEHLQVRQLQEYTLSLKDREENVYKHELAQKITDQDIKTLQKILDKMYQELDPEIYGNKLFNLHKNTITMDLGEYDKYLYYQDLYDYEVGFKQQKPNMPDTMKAGSYGLVIFLVLLALAMLGVIAFLVLKLQKKPDELLIQDV